MKFDEEQRFLKRPVRERVNRKLYFKKKLINSPVDRPITGKIVRTPGSLYLSSQGWRTSQIEAECNVDVHDQENPFVVGRRFTNRRKAFQRNESVCTAYRRFAGRRRRFHFRENVFSCFSELAICKKLMWGVAVSALLRLEILYWEW